LKKAEKQICYSLAEYLSLKYPNLIFRWDVGADIRLTIGQAMVIKNKLLHQKGYPDLFIARPVGGYAGLFLEVKQGFSEVYRKDGTLKNNKHIREQAEMLDRLNALGYKAEFCLNLDDCMEKIDKYLRGQQ